MVTPDVAHWFYAAMLDGIVTGLRGTDLDVLLYEVKEERERGRFFAELPARRQVDALILVALPISDDERRRLDLMGVTVVMAGGTLGDHPHVRIDDVEAGRQAGRATGPGRARADRDDRFRRRLEPGVRGPGARAARLHRRAQGGRRSRCARSSSSTAGGAATAGSRA